MDFLLGAFLLFGVPGLLWMMVKLERQGARLERAELSVEHLYLAGSALAQRVIALESRHSAPTSAYRHAPEVEAPAPGQALLPFASAPSPIAAPSPAPSRVSVPLGAGPAPAWGAHAGPAPAWGAHAGPAPLGALPGVASAGPGGYAPTRVDPAAFVSAPSAAGAAPAPSIDLDADAATHAPAIDWERWIGVRGAAALGAGILVIALFYFLRYSITEGWLTVELRVLLGAVVSAACVGAAELRFRATHQVLANWLTGAGVAGLYASGWAAQHVAGVLGPLPSFGLVVGLTAGSVALALRANALPIALLGITGGFAAPLSLSLDTAGPWAIVAYVLLLDVAMVTLAARKGWWSLSALSMLLTAAYEAVWVSSHGGAGNLPLQIGVLTVFAGVFGGVPALALGDVGAKDAPPAPLARLTRYGSVLVPLGFAAWLTADPAVLHEPAPIGALLVLLTAMAGVIAVRQREAVLPMLAALAAPAVLLSWVISGDPAAHAMSFGVLLVVLGATHAATVLIEERRAAKAPAGSNDVLDVARGAVVLYGAGAVGLIVCAAALHPGPWAAYLGAVVVLAGGALALVARSGMVGLAGLAMAGASAALLAIAALHTGAGAAPAVSALLLAVATSAAAQVVARRLAGEAAAELVAGARRAALLTLGGLGLFASTLELGVYACVATALAACALAARRDEGATYPLVGGLSAAALGLHGWLASDGGTPTSGIAACALALALLAAPLVRRLGLSESVWAPRGQVLTLGAFALAVGSRFLAPEPEVLGPALLALAALAVGLCAATTRVTRAEVVRAEAASWLGTVSVALVAAGLCLSLSAEWLTFGLALFGLSLVGLARWRESDALAIAGVAHLAVATLRVVANPAVLSYHPRGEVAVFNWMTPTFLVPALSAALAWWVLSSAPGRDSGDRRLSAVPAAMAWLTIFAWLNVCVLDVFAAGGTISLQTSSPQARDLSMSLVWGVFGTTLLVTGMRRRHGGLRWASLALVLVTAGKVFLYDLAQLRDLYRVASLAGLALSLLGISVLYQRFVFRGGAASAAVQPPTRLAPQPSPVPPSFGSPSQVDSGP